MDLLPRAEPAANLSMTPAAYTKRLPSPHGVALAIMQACRDDNVSVTDVARLVQSDPALTGRLLELSNSAAMGGRPVVSALDAVNRLGLQAVRHLALSFSLVDQHGQGQCKGFDYAMFWSHSLFMAVAVRDLGVLLRLGPPDDLFSCGLLTRVGCLAMATVFPLEYTDILRQANDRQALLQLENQVLLTDHLQLTGLLHAQWGLPIVLTQPVLAHEAPDEASFETGSRAWNLAQVIHLALRLADFIVRAPQEQARQIADMSLLAGQLGIEATQFDKCVDQIMQGWKEWGARLKIRVAADTPYSVLSKARVRPDQDSNLSWLRVLVVDDDPVTRQLLQTWLAQDCQFNVTLANDGQEALTVAMGLHPHVVLTDWMMPVLDGLGLCRALRASEWGQNIYIVMLTSNETEDDLVTAFDAGVDDYLVKPIKRRALNARLKAAWRYVSLRDAWERDHDRLTRAADELAISNRRLQYAALTDPLTELSNRRAGLLALGQAWAASVRHDHQVASVLSLDLDHFKTINDRHGHAGGDLVLQKTSQILRAAARREDTVCRWGGEEFLLICPNMTLRQGLQAAERLRRTIEASYIQIDGKSVGITVSVGVASWRTDMVSQDQLLNEADQALYIAKQGGRNRVAIIPGKAG